MRVTLDLPEQFKLAAEAEAGRRGITLSSLVKSYLASFLPENIQKSTLMMNAAGNHGKSERKNL